MVSGDAGLQFAMRPVPRDIFRIAFQKPIGLPRPNETSADLWERGGVEVGRSNYRMILSNTSSEPVTVVSVRLEVLGSKPRPEGALAYKFTQGAEGLAQLGAMISQTRPGTVAHLYDSSRGIPSPLQRKTTPPYFETTFVHLEPGEVYPGSVSVQAEPQRLVHFRFIAEGSSARHHFVERSPTYSIVGGMASPAWNATTASTSKGNSQASVRRRLKATGTTSVCPTEMEAGPSVRKVRKRRRRLRCRIRPHTRRVDSTSTSVWIREHRADR
jgi:hypothetical protein